MPIWASISRASREILLEVVSISGAVLSPAVTPPPSESMPVLGVFVSINSTSIELRIEEERLRFWQEEFTRIRDMSRKKDPRQSHGGAPRVRRLGGVGVSHEGSLQRPLQDRLRGLPQFAPG